MAIPADFKERYYILNISRYYGSNRYVLRDLFDAAGDFISYCQANCSMDHYQANIIFDLQAEYIKNLPVLSQHEHLLKLSNTDLSQINLPNKLNIYGLGVVGKDFYDKIKEYTKIKCFIDKAPKEEYYDNIPVVKLSEYRHDSETYIVVTPSYEYYKICIDLKDTCGIPLKQVVPLEYFLLHGVNV